MAGHGLRFFLDVVRAERPRRAAVRLGLLGLGRDNVAECSDQRLDRPGFPDWDNLYLSAADQESPPSAAASSVFKLSGFSGDCVAMACAGGNSQSCTGRGAWILLV